MADVATWPPQPVAVIGVGGTLLGTLIGSWAGYIVSLRVERARWERDDRIRYNLERIRAYAEFLTTGAVVLTGVQQIGPTANMEQCATLQAAAQNAFMESRVGLQRSYFQTHILATPPVREAANALYRLLLQPDSEDRTNRIMEARGVFIDAAQVELGVPMEPPASSSQKG